MRLYLITLTTALVATLQLIVTTGCSRRADDAPVADLIYLSAQAKRVVDDLNAQSDGHDCKIVGNYGAGEYVLTEASCADGSYVEIGYKANMRAILVGVIWLAPDAKSRVKEEDLMLDIHAPQMEAWMLIDKRDHH